MSYKLQTEIEHIVFELSQQASHGAGTLTTLPAIFRATFLFNDTDDMIVFGIDDTGHPVMVEFIRVTFDTGSWDSFAYEVNIFGRMCIDLINALREEEPYVYDDISERIASTLPQECDDETDS